MHYYSTKIYPKDYELSLHFYQNILKLPVTQEYENALLLDEHLLLCRNNRGFDGATVTLYFETENYGAFEDLVRANDLSFGSRLSPAGQRILTLCDPDGNLIEVGEPMHDIVSALLQLSNFNS